VNGTLNLALGGSSTVSSGTLSAINTLTSSGALTLSNTTTSGSLGSNTIATGLATFSNAIVWLPPWYRGNSGHELLIFDVSNPAAPTFTKTLDVRTGSTGDWSAPIALGGKLYLSYIAADDSDVVDLGSTFAIGQPRKFRHFMKVVDFAEAANPAVGDEINIPGRLLNVTGGGATLLTVGCGYDADGNPTGTRVFHTSHFDGAAAQLVDQLQTPTAWDPFALDGATLLVGAWPSGDGESGQIQAWLIGADEKFSLASQISAPTFSGLSALHGLLVGNGNGLPHLFDVSDPANLVDLSSADTSELTSGDLTHADGGAGLGIWQPLGDSGVGVVSLSQ